MVSEIGVLCDQFDFMVVLEIAIHS